MLDLTSQTAVVTGAGSGIGRAIALQLARHGVCAYLVARSLAAVEETASLGGEATGRLVPHSADITVDEDAAGLRARLERERGHLDILIHSAGTITLGAIEDTGVADLDRQYKVNCRAPYVLTQCLLPLLRPEPPALSQIVFINSTAGKSAKAFVGLYAASKFAARALADSLRDEVNALGIRVLTLYPGRTATPMQETVSEMEGRSYDPSRYMQPGDVAATVLCALTLPPTAEITEISMRPFRK